MTRDRKTIAGHAEVKAAGDGRLTFTMSTNSVDRDGDRIEQNWIVPKGGVPMLHEHNWDAPPIGRIPAVKSDGSRTTFEPIFVPREIYPFAGMIEDLYRLGFMKAVSPGFIPLEVRQASFEERKTAGVTGEWIDRSELLEVSAVNIPANAEALIASGGKNMAPIYRGAGTHDERVGELVTKGLKRDAVMAWHEGEAMKLSTITKAAPPPPAAPAAPPQAPPQPAEQAPTDPMACLDQIEALLTGGGEVSAQQILDLVKQCKAGMGEEAPPAEGEGGAPPPPPPGKAFLLINGKRLEIELSYPDTKSAAASVAGEGNEELGVDDVEMALSDSDFLSKLMADLNISDGQEG